MNAAKRFDGNTILFHINFCAAASRVPLALPPGAPLWGPGYGLKSAPARGSGMRDGAELGGCKAPLCQPLTSCQWGPGSYHAGFLVLVWQSSVCRSVKSRRPHPDFS